MPPRTTLAVCPKCACHAKLNDSQCPCCGTVVRSHEWLMPAAVLAMGLTAAACGTTVSDGSGAGGSSGVAGGGGQGGVMSQTTYGHASGYTAGVSVDTSAGVGGAGGAGGAGGN